jgi:DNA gyrase subunit A
MEGDEQPATIYSIYKDTDAKYVFFATKNGTVKKTYLSEYIDTKKKNGIGAIKLKEDDNLAAVSLINEEDILLITKKGYLIKFSSLDVSSTGRLTSGVKGINLSEDDEVIAALPVRDDNDELAVFSVGGYGKRIPKEDMTIQKRGGKGVICYKGPDEELAAAQLVNDKDQVLIIGNKSSICINAQDIPSLGRIATGNIMIKGNRIMTVSKV